MERQAKTDFYMIIFASTITIVVIVPFMIARILLTHNLKTFELRSNFSLNFICCSIFLFFVNYLAIKHSLYCFFSLFRFFSTLMTLYEISYEILLFSL